MSDNTLLGAALGQWYPPAGFSTVFTGQYGSMFAPNYIGVAQLASYSPTDCGNLCLNTAGCQAINIYYERTATVIPSDACPNPNAASAVRCALYGSPLTAAQATNNGQYQKDFMVVIQGSNAYNLNPMPSSVASYLAPQPLYGASLISSINGKSVSLGNKVYSSWSPTTCVQACSDMTSQNRASAVSSALPTYSPCNYVDAFMLNVGTRPVAMQCNFYTDDAAGNYATATYGLSGSTILNVTSSYGYALDPQDNGYTNYTWAPHPAPSAASCAAMAAKSGSYVTPQLNNYTLGCGMDVQYSNDIGNNTSPDFYGCFGQCDAFPGCNGFAYLGNTCYFKNLAKSPRTPQPDNYGTDMAWMPAFYGGFSANTIAATLSWTTITTAWTGSSTTTITSIRDTTAFAIVETPGLTATGAPTVNTFVDKGTNSVIQTSTTTNGGTVTVQTIYPTPATTCGNGGIAYAAYALSQTNNLANNQFTQYNPTTIKTVQPTTTGIASYVGEYNGASGPVTIYGVNQKNPQFITLGHTFYLYAGRGTGFYSINLPFQDDITFVWQGATALSGWSRDNAAMIKPYNTNQNSPLTLAWYLTAGTYTPFRIQFGNGGGPGQLTVNMYAPDGSPLLNTYASANAGYMAPQFVMAPCNKTLGAAFPQWGRET